jgi:hypothetical protein
MSTFDEKAREDKILDQLTQLADDHETLLAESVFQVAHYNKEYKGAASLADVAFELAETDENVHKALSQSWKLGAEFAEPALEMAKELGYITQEKSGGYVITQEGRGYLQSVREKLGNTYESEHEGDEF